MKELSAADAYMQGAADAFCCLDDERDAIIEQSIIIESVADDFRAKVARLETEAEALRDRVASLENEAVLLRADAESSRDKLASARVKLEEFKERSNADRARLVKSASALQSENNRLTVIAGRRGFGHSDALEAAFKLCVQHFCGNQRDSPLSLLVRVASALADIIERVREEEK